MPLFIYNRRMIRCLYAVQSTPQRIILSIRHTYGNRPPSPDPVPGSWPGPTRTFPLEESGLSVIAKQATVLDLCLHNELRTAPTVVECHTQIIHTASIGLSSCDKNISTISSVNANVAEQTPEYCNQKQSCWKHIQRLLSISPPNGCEIC